MNFAIQKMRLEARSLYALIFTWTDMQLEVTGEKAVITGYGYDFDIAEAFTTLMFDWEASIFLPREEINLESGTYDLFLDGDNLFACREGEEYWLADGAVTVEVVSLEDA